jgi:hypothetical protein
LFSGANFSGEVQIVVAPRGRVVFKEEAVSGECGAVSGERPKATDLQVANALMAINGKGKPLSNYQTWLGACVLLSSKYDLSVANHVHRQTLFIHQSSFPFSCIFCIYSIPLYAKISKETFLICTELFAT